MQVKRTKRKLKSNMTKEELVKEINKFLKKDERFLDVALIMINAVTENEIPKITNDGYLFKQNKEDFKTLLESLQELDSDE